MFARFLIIASLASATALAQTNQQPGPNVGPAAKPGAQAVQQNQNAAPNANTASQATQPEASGAKRAEEEPGASALPQSDIENPAVSDTSNLQNEIQQAIAREPMLENSQINVAVKDGDIELTGSVPSGKARETARRIASSYAVNQRVIDHMKMAISPLPGLPQSKEPSQPASTPPPHR